MTTINCSICGKELTGGPDTFGWPDPLCQECFWESPQGKTTKVTKGSNSETAFQQHIRRTTGLTINNAFSSEGQKKVLVHSMNKYCVVCGKEFGPNLEIHCTDKSLVAYSRMGSFMAKTIYYSLDGRELSQMDLIRLKEIEKSRLDTWKKEQKKHLQETTYHEKDSLSQRVRGELVSLPILGGGIPEVLEILAGILIDHANTRFQYIQEFIKNPKADFTMPDPIKLVTSYDDNLFAGLLFIVLSHMRFSNVTSGRLPSAMIILPNVTEVNEFLISKWGSQDVPTQAFLSFASLKAVNFSELISNYQKSNFFSKAGRFNLIQTALSDPSSVLVTDQRCVSRELNILGLERKNELDFALWEPRWLVTVTSEGCTSWGCIKDVILTTSYSRLQSKR